MVALVLLTLLFQAFVFWLLGPLVPGVDVDAGIIGLLVISFLYGFLQAGVSALFGLGEEGSYYGTLVRTMASHNPDITKTDEPGIVIVQLDGLSHDVMSHSVRAGRVPDMCSWLRDGTHRLGHWDALLPSTTPASQAGILHGNNDGIPNFRWWEKKERRLLVANHPEDATVIEQRISNGEGLLSPGGASISNIFTGDADRAFLVMSTIKVKERGLGQSDAFAWFFVSPYNYLVMGAKYLAEVVKERYQSWRQQRAGMVPHMGHHRGFPYPFVRAATNVALRALGTSLIIQEMYRGTPVIYMDYTDYDEIAHHSGPERPESLDALDGVDRELGILKKAAETAARPYRFVILADHGQSLGQTFLQRYGVTLQDVVRSLMGGQASVAAATAQIEDWGQLNTFLGEVSETKGVSGSLARTVTHDRRTGEQVDLVLAEPSFTPAGPTAAPVKVEGDEAAEGAAEVADLVVVAGGNLALVYFNISDERMTLDQIEAAYPALASALVGHPGIGPHAGAARPTTAPSRWARRASTSSTRTASRARTRWPIYGKLAATALRRLDGIANVGDIALVSQYDPETFEIAAFEELIGAHGGLGGPQTRPFLLYPTDWELDEGPLVGAPAVYRQLRRWMEQHLGMTFGLTKAGAASAEKATEPTDLASGPVATSEPTASV